MQSFVLDVSACLPWCYEDEQTPFTDQLLEWAASGSHLHVPSIWPPEILNALGQGVRRKRLPAGRAAEFLEQLKTLAFHIEPAPTLADLPQTSRIPRRSARLAHRHRS